MNVFQRRRKSHLSGMIVTIGPYKLVNVLKIIQYPKGSVGSVK
jgi:hypothetical protein